MAPAVLSPPSFDVAEYERLSEPAQLLVGQAFRYVMSLGTALECGSRDPSRMEDGRQRSAWRQGVALIRGPEQVRVSSMVADAMEAVKVLRSQPPTIQRQVSSLNERGPTLRRRV